MLFGSFRKKFSGALHHLELCSIALNTKDKTAPGGIARKFRDRSIRGPVMKG